MIHTLSTCICAWMQSQARTSGSLCFVFFVSVFGMRVLAKTPQEHLDYTCVDIASAEAAASESLWLVTGEWSLATTDCARWLNGMLKGSRWDGTLNAGVAALGNCTGDAGNDFQAFSPEYIAFLRKMAESQMDVYENASNTADSGSAGWVSSASNAHLQLARRPRCCPQSHPLRTKPCSFSRVLLGRPRVMMQFFWNFRTESSPQW